MQATDTWQEAILVDHAVDIPQSPAGMRQLGYGRHDAILDCIGAPDCPKHGVLRRHPRRRERMLPKIGENTPPENRYSAPPGFE